MIFFFESPKKKKMNTNVDPQTFLNDFKASIAAKDVDAEDGEIISKEPIFISYKLDYSAFTPPEFKAHPKDADDPTKFTSKGVARFIKNKTNKRIRLLVRTASNFAKGLNFYPLVKLNKYGDKVVFSLVVDETTPSKCKYLYFPSDNKEFVDSFNQAVEENLKLLK